MVNLVFLLQATQYGNRGLHRRFAHNDFLKAPLQRCVFFNEFSVLIQSRRAYTMQFAPGQRRLEHIAGVHRTFGLAGTHHGV